MAGPQATKKTESTTPKPKVEAEAPKAPSLYPVKLIKNYRPDGEFKILEQVDPEDENSEWASRNPEGEKEELDERGHIIKMSAGDYKKVFKDTVILLPKDVARKLLKTNVAQRHDDL